MDLYLLTEDVTRLEDQLYRAKGSARLKVLVALAWALRQRDSARALELAREGETRLVDSTMGPGAEEMSARLQLVRMEIATLFGDLVLAEELLERCKRTFVAVKDPVGEGDAYVGEVLIAMSEGQRDRYNEACARALQCYSIAKDELRIQMTKALAAFLTSHSDPSEGERDLNDFYRIYKAPFHSAVSAMILAADAQLNFSREPARSAAFFTQARDLAREAGLVRHAIVASGNAGAALSALGQLGDAAGCFEWAVTESRRTQWPWTIGISLMRMGELLRDLGQLEASRAALEEAVEQFNTAKGGNNKATAYSGLAQTLLLSGHPAEAVPAFETALRVYRELQVMDNLAIDLIGLGKALAATGKPQEALVAFEEARTIVARFGYESLEITLMEALADTHRRHRLAPPAELDGAPDAVVYYLKRAMAVGKRVEGWSSPTPLLLALADALANAGDTAGAFHYAKEAVKAEQDEKTRHASNQVAFLQVRHETERAKADADHHRQLAQTLEATSRTLAQLGKVGQEITAHLDGQGVFTALYRNLDALVDAHHLALWLLDDSGDTLTLRYGLEDGKPLPLRTVQRDSPTSAVARSAREQKEILYKYREGDPHPSTIPGTRDMLTAFFGPLIISERVVGVVSIQSSRVDAYGERELLIFRTLCAYSAIALDNTQVYRRLQEAQGKLEEATLTDPLTNLRNRRFLAQNIESDTAVSLRRYKSSSAESRPTDADLLFFLVDLDHFKQVNDIFGHAAGDAVLTQMHGRLAEVFRTSDHLVRWGGEEFLIVARSTSREGAEQLAERLRANVAEKPFILDDGSSLHKTCSIGFACFPFVPAVPECLGWQDVVAIADLALYAAKRAGRNQWVGLLAGARVDTAQLAARIKGNPETLLLSAQLALVSSTARADTPGLFAPHALS